MNDRQLKSFLLTADHRSFAKAAAASYISTSALISQITLLERDTGLTLFTRNPRGIELTKEGEVFYKYASKVLELLEEAPAVARMAAKQEQNLITIHGRDLNFTHIFKRFCVDYKEQNPEIRITFGEKSIDEMYESFLKNPAALFVCGKMRNQYETELEFLPLFEDQLLLLGPEKHPLMQKTLLKMEDLKGYNILCEKHMIDSIDYEDLFKNISDVHLTFCEPFHSELPILNAFSNGQLVLRPQRWSCFALNLIKQIPIETGTDLSVGIYYHKNCPAYIRDFIEAYEDHWGRGL